jgi:UPF0716 family protein affecting phage T7 exclusion
MSKQRSEADVIECEAVPLEPARGSPPRRRLAPWIFLLVLLIPLLVLLVVFRLAAVAMAVFVALARHPIGLALIAALALWAWHAWRGQRERRAP